MLRFYMPKCPATTNGKVGTALSWRKSTDFNKITTLAPIEEDAISEYGTYRCRCSATVVIEGKAYPLTFESEPVEYEGKIDSKEISQKLKCKIVTGDLPLEDTVIIKKYFDVINTVRSDV